VREADAGARPKQVAALLFQQEARRRRRCRHSSAPGHLATCVLAVLVVVDNDALRGLFLLRALV
jgi:hypothetical protein